MKKLKIGVISTAGIATRSVIPSILTLQDYFELAGIASRTKEKANHYATDFNTKPYYSYEELLDNTRLDAVYIPLPNSLHYHWVGEALKRGVHVLVEKSLGCNYKEVEELTQMARDNECVLVENFQFRFHKQLRELKRLLFEDKIIGDLRVIRSFFGFPPFPDEDNIRYKPELGGGALLDAGAYTIKVSQLLLGDTLKIKAASLHQDEELGVDLWGNGMLSEPESALSSHISFGFDNFYQNGIEAWGSKGKLFTNRLFTARDNFEPEFNVMTNEGEQIIKISCDDHFRNMLTHFHTLITNGNSKDIENEHSQNLNQALLIEDFKQTAHAE